jgi:hypothetical protein
MKWLHLSSRKLFDLEIRPGVIGRWPVSIANGDI